ncbi:MAG: hypothetical protein QME75_03635, partial [Deltaproteobacteria bacterium]|nr:hypothetical protein [Deltaproteobacteria bacterium]
PLGKHALAQSSVLLKTDNTCGKVPFATEPGAHVRSQAGAWERDKKSGALHQNGFPSRSLGTREDKKAQAGRLCHLA